MKPAGKSSLYFYSGVCCVKENGELDLESLNRLVEYLSTRVKGLFITGSYGCGVMMSTEERMRVTEETIRSTQGRIPVADHVGTADSFSARKLTEHAVACGAAVVSAVGPFYFKHTADSICHYYSEILESTAGSIPTYVYNNPQF